MKQQQTLALVRLRYSEEVRSAEREVRAAEERLKDARSRLEAVEDVVQTLFGKSEELPAQNGASSFHPYALMPLREAILRVISQGNSDGATVREIQHRLLEGGFPKATKNFNAIVSITCKRLAGNSLLRASTGPGVRRYLSAHHSSTPS